MSSEQPRRGRESAGSPFGSTAAIVIAIVAVVLGFFIIRQILDDDDDAGSSIVTAPSDDSSGSGVSTAPGDTTVTVPSSQTIAPTVAIETTTTAAVTTKGAIVVVANASTVNGAAGQLTTALTGKGFDLVAATNASTKIDVSQVFYDPANPQAQAVAMTVASFMGIADVLPLETPAPVNGGTLQGGATVLVMVGSDKASQTLDQMSQGGTATTVAGATTTVAATTTG